jgi:hypothetical protein
MILWHCHEFGGLSRESRTTSVSWSAATLPRTLRRIYLHYRRPKLPITRFCLHPFLPFLKHKEIKSVLCYDVAM